MLQHVEMAVSLILLVAIGCGVFRILRHTRFVAQVVAKNMAEAEDAEVKASTPRQAVAPQDDSDDIGTRPVGFGVCLQERN